MISKRDIIQFAKKYIKHIKDPLGTRLYRCSATLEDGLYLPCIILQAARPHLETTIKWLEHKDRFKNLHKSIGYRAHVKRLACEGNRVDVSSIRKIELSPYAFPPKIVQDIYNGGETCMGSTSFTGIMDDGKMFHFGTAYDPNFFELPDNYTGDRIVKVIVRTREAREYIKQWDDDRYYRSRPYFVCYIDKL